MLAPRPMESSTARPAPEPVPVSAPEVRIPLRPATDEDAAAGSPVHALQARLADEIDPSSRPRRAFDPMWLLIVAGNAACWWGLISLGVLVARHLPH